jgi:hypothetical protein
MEINRLLCVGQIVDTYLTDETLKKLYSPAYMDEVLPEKVDMGARNKLFVDLLEYSGGATERELGRNLLSDEVMLVYNRVRQFMIARGLD